MSMVEPGERSPADIGFIGVGAIAEAMVIGLATADAPAPTVLLSPRGHVRSRRLAARFPTVKVAADNQAVADGSHLLVLAVRPLQLPDVLRAVHFPPDQPIISVVATVEIDELQRQVAPARVAARAIPLPSVAERQGLTALWPADARAVDLFDRLGTCFAVDGEHTLVDLSIASGTVAAGAAYYAAVQRWLIARGMVEAEAGRYVAALFTPLLQLLDAPPDDLTELASRHTTPGGLNERFLESVRARGIFTAVEEALDELSDSFGLRQKPEVTSQ